MVQRNMVKCNCHRLKYLVLYYKRVIALIMRNIVPRSISYCTRQLVHYDILLGKIFLNMSAITLYYWIEQLLVILWYVFILLKLPSIWEWSLFVIHWLRRIFQKWMQINLETHWHAHWHKMKNKIYLTVGTVPKCNWKVVQRGKIETINTHTYI